MKSKIFSSLVIVALVSIAYLAYKPLPKGPVKKADKQTYTELGEFVGQNGTVLELLGNGNVPAEVQGFYCGCDAVSASGTYKRGTYPSCNITFNGSAYGWGTSYSGELQFY